MQTKRNLINLKEASIYTSLFLLGGFIMNLYERNALMFAEKYGIIEYRIRGYNMIYNKSYPACACEPRYTVQHTVDLRTMQESTRRLKRFDPKGIVNVY